jgi:MFS family permease
MAINGICVAYTTGGNNQTASIFAAKMEWDAEQTRRNNTIINTASYLGGTIGAYIGGRLIPYGRKKTYLWGNFLALLSCLMMQIVSLETLAIGKLLNALFVTVVHIA